MVLYFQVEEEATDKDNKNCSKDGMCSKVRLSLPFLYLIELLSFSSDDNTTVWKLLRAAQPHVLVTWKPN